MREYRICKRCIMDTSDEDIVFDENGVCNHCTRANYIISSPPLNFSKIKKRQALKRIVNKIKRESKGNKYDCIIGLSGGVDSTYVAYLVKQMGLNPLAVHLDNGWDSEIAVSNIEQTLRALDIDLYTEVLNWEEFRNLQLSFLKASVPDLEIPSDHAIIASLLKIATKFNIKYVISGHNERTESIGVAKWSTGHYDWRYINRLQKRFGKKKLKTFPKMSILTLFKYKFIRNIKSVRILNYVDYNKKEALDTIKNKLGWRDYGGKHCESNYTKFIQSYILPSKFNYDKRRCHLSNLIVAGEITRKEALKEIERPVYNDKQLKIDIAHVSNKLGISVKEFKKIMALPNKSYFDYPSYNTVAVYRLLRETYKKMKSI